MDPITGGTCKCNASSSNLQEFGVLVNDVTWNPPNLYTCHGREGGSYFIKCKENYGVATMAIQSDVILLGVCLLLLLVSTYLFYKLKKVKSYYKGKIEALEKEYMGALSNDPRNSND